MQDLLKRLNQNYPYSPIAYHDSWISVDPIIGCQLNCQYCYMRMTQWTGVKPHLLYSILPIVDMLLCHNYFLAHKTLLSFGNQTDPFLEDNVEHTLSFLKLLEECKLRNPVALVTKKIIPNFFIDKSLKLKYVRPIFCLSYSGIPTSVEKGVNPEENRKNFQNLSECKLRTIHFWRPLLEINGTYDILKEVLDFVAQYSHASVYIGLKLNPHLSPIYSQNRYLRIPQQLKNYYGDYIPQGVEERLRSIAERYYPHYPLYKHTSCAISFVLSVSDYNATVYRDPICKSSNCPILKRKICEEARAIPNYAQIQTLLSTIGKDCDFKITKNAVEIFGELGHEDYTFLLHQLNFPINAKEIRYNSVLQGSIFRKDGESLAVR